LGVVCERERKFDQARQIFERAAGLEPNSLRVLVELARVANDLKDPTGALAYLAHARDLDPQNAGVHFLWGMICVEEHLPEAAYKALQKAVSLEPNNPDYLYAMGAVAVQRTDASDAIPYFRKCCELKPDDPRGNWR